jgi:glycosyltransferase involved in cell wall biosynthesis
MSQSRRRLRLGIVTNELLAPELSPLGGFGYAASSVARLFSSEPSLGVDVTILACTRMNVSDNRTEAVSDGAAVLIRPPQLDRWPVMLERERIDLLLTIDYRPSYDIVLETFARTPVIMWVRDPRTPADVARVQTLKIPGGGEATPPGIARVPTTGLRRLALKSLLRRRRFAFRFTSPDLAAKFAGCYGWLRPRRIEVLPNIVEASSCLDVRSPEPLVVFLGRLDPIKRPWIAVAVARAMPDVRFSLLGTIHFPETFRVDDMPPNLQVLGHVHGMDKARWLSRAWMLMNSSIHEALPISFLEALAHALPIVSSVNPDGLVSSFGVHVPMSDGDGLASVPLYVAALRRLIDDRALAERLGHSGQEWLKEHHGTVPFLKAFALACDRLDVPVPVPVAPGAATTV